MSLQRHGNACPSHRRLAHVPRICPTFLLGISLGFPPASRTNELQLSSANHDRLQSRRPRKALGISPVEGSLRRDIAFAKEVYCALHAGSLAARRNCTSLTMRCDLQATSIYMFGVNNISSPGLPME